MSTPNDNKTPHPESGKWHPSVPMAYRRKYYEEARTQQTKATQPQPPQKMTATEARLGRTLRSFQAQAEAWKKDRDTYKRERDALQAQRDEYGNLLREVLEQAEETRAINLDLGSRIQHAIGKVRAT